MMTNKWQQPNNRTLVGGIPTPLKNMKVNGKDDIPYIVENKKMFETTNQNILNKYVDSINKYRNKHKQTIETAYKSKSIINQL